MTIDSTKDIQTSGGVKGPITVPTAGATVQEGGAVDEAFEQIIRSFIAPDADNNTNEEELFAAVVGERIQHVKGGDVRDIYTQLFNAELEISKATDGSLSYEDASRAALQDMVAGKYLSDTEATKIHGEAFAAAQLDDNHDLLFDGKGGEGDATIAVQSMEAALITAKLMLNQFDSGVKSADPMSLIGSTRGFDLATLRALAPTAPPTLVEEEVPLEEEEIPLAEPKRKHPKDADLSAETIEPNGTRIDGRGGYVYRPESRKDGNLVVVMNEEFQDKIKKVVIRDAAGNEIESGSFDGVGHRGRSRFRFSKRGEEYGEDITVEFRMKGGEGSKKLKIKNSGEEHN
jgi:hypothetical protein